MAAKILIVDDDMETLKLVGLMLQRQGYQIVAANSGKQAIVLAKSEQPELIILDIMMPDMDGYEVARQIRKDPQTAAMAILMFSAKNQAADKVAGYDAGVDDYVTKPIHPAELMVRIKALLSRGEVRSTRGEVPLRGHTIGFLASKGGVGLSTTILNTAILLHQKHKLDVIVTELRPGQGSNALDLGFTSPESLNKLLKSPPDEITANAVEDQLLRISYGIRLLMASSHIQDASLLTQTEQIEMVIRRLPELGQLVLLDIGASFLPNIDQVLSHCQELIVGIEPYPSSIQRARLLLDDVARTGFGKSRLLHVVSINRLQADDQHSATQLQEILGRPIAQVISPVPELAFQATQRGLPLLQIQPESLAVQQYTQLANQIAERIQQ
ncbi:MAG: response regulator [Anaerolineaceae bacterium]|nr:response regulator [Anaerolineaceae bacterium]